MPTNQDGFSSMENISREQMNELLKPKSEALTAGNPTIPFRANENIKNYIGCKIIKAEPMSQEDFLREIGKWKENQETYGDGYKVYYSDNYQSWSPKKVFDESYRLISTSEMSLLHKQYEKK